MNKFEQSSINFAPQSQIEANNTQNESSVSPAASVPNAYQKQVSDFSKLYLRAGAASNTDIDGAGKNQKADGDESGIQGPMSQTNTDITGGHTF